MHASQEAAKGAKRGRIDDNRPQDDNRRAKEETTTSVQKGGGKRNANGKKGNGQGNVAESWKAGFNKKTPDGRWKCQFFQKDSCRNGDTCKMAHLCYVCNKPHPMLRCDQKPKKDGAK